jgi:hypothetical protein
MRSFLPVLCLFALLAAGPAAGSGPVENPHPTVEEENFCAGCHTCDRPTPEDPCLVDCPRHGSRFLGDHDADEGPEVVLIDQLANLYEPVVFAHRLHADMSNMTGGCENCHHYSEPGGVIPPCRECHEVNRSAVDLNQPALKGAYHRQCMNCHRDWSHENACAFCHEEADGDPAAAHHDPTDIVGVPHPLIEATPSYFYDTSYEEAPMVTFHHEDHVEMFGLACVDCHRGDSCARCHDSERKETTVAKLDHTASCFSCHGERDCGFCHNHEAKPPFNHGTSVGWALDPYHGEVACTTCHGQPQSFRTPSGHCSDCHIHWEAGSFDHAVTGLVLSEDHVDLDCGDCHRGMNMEVPPACDDCHDEAMLPDYLPGKRVSMR